jgi:hypothetical protein
MEPGSLTAAFDLAQGRCLPTTGKRVVGERTKQ